MVKRIDTLTSVIVRYGGHKTKARCVSCGRTLPIEQIDAGHFVGRGCMATRFDYHYNVNPECLTGEAPLMLSNRKKILQNDVKVGDMIIGHDDGHEIITRVDYVEKIKSPIIRIELSDGYMFRGSPNHRVLTTNGYMKLSDIEKCIANGDACDVISLGRNTLSVVRAVQEEADDYVYLMETSSGTFVSDKICHHNCQRCNRFSPDHLVGYANYIVSNHGVEKLQELNDIKSAWRAGKIKPFSMAELRSIYNQYLPLARSCNKEKIPSNWKPMT